MGSEGPLPPRWPVSTANDDQDDGGEGIAGWTGDDDTDDDEDEEAGAWDENSGARRRAPIPEGRF